MPPFVAAAANESATHKTFFANATAALGVMCIAAVTLRIASGYVVGTSPTSAIQNGALLVNGLGLILGLVAGLISILRSEQQQGRRYFGLGLVALAMVLLIVTEKS